MGEFFTKKLLDGDFAVITAASTAISAMVPEAEVVFQRIFSVVMQIKKHAKIVVCS